MESMGQVTVRNELPDAEAFREYDRLVVLAPHVSASGFTANDIAKLSLTEQGRTPRLLWLVGHLKSYGIVGRGGITPASWRMPLSSLAAFIAPVE